MALPIETKLLELQAEQAVKRKGRTTDYALTDTAEFKTIAKLALRLFGNSRERYSWLPGPGMGSPAGRPYRYGALFEKGPEEPGVHYVGFFIDPPNIMPAKRRRQLVFRFFTYNEFCQQVKLLGFTV